MKIVVLGYIVRCPLGGMSAAYLQYTLGFKALGHEVLYIEDSDNYESCYNPKKWVTSTDPTYGLEYAQDLFREYDLQNNWSYFDEHSGRWFGLSQQQVQVFCDKADIVINISGSNPMRDWWAKIPCRVLIDTDPGFTQISHLTHPKKMEIASCYTSYFTLAENINAESCSVPADGFPWVPTRQPIFHPIWKIADVSEHKWTTVMQWSSYTAREYNGRLYGMKSDSFRSYEDLPAKLPGEKLELAIGEFPEEQKLIAKGWHITDPLIPTMTFSSYQKYIESSRGEWTVAKQGYVITNSGWFSERSACYLAAGKPVIVQDTGFSQLVDTGEGILTFTNIDEAVESFHRINRDYTTHRIAARKWAENYFDYKTVINTMLYHL